MEMAISEITLVVFTTIAPAGAIGYVLLAAAILLTRDDAVAKRLSTYLVIPLLLALVGLISSATHLGTPANALYVLTGIGRSPLSNEVVAAAVFLAFGGAAWILSFGHRRRDALSSFGLGFAALTALVFVEFVARAYSVETIPTWNFPAAPWTLWANALASGPAVALLVYACADIMAPRRFAFVAMAVSLCAVAVNIALLLFERAGLNGVVTTVARASDLMAFLPGALVAFAVLCCLGVTVCFLSATHRRFAALSKRRTRIAWCILGVAIALIGCFAVRFSFYAMYMTWGI
ncbi:MAG: dimethyl sulfoxide reductase anchor subunit [Slackia sp.]|nr:dimethyl sulfoxide reductase anchor subunit [Slackia sp.]